MRINLGEDTNLEMRNENLILIKNENENGRIKMENKCYNALKFLSNVNICIFCYLASSQLRPTR